MNTGIDSGAMLEDNPDCKPCPGDNELHFRLGSIVAFDTCMRTLQGEYTHEPQHRSRSMAAQIAIEAEFEKSFPTPVPDEKPWKDTDENRASEKWMEEAHKGFWGGASLGLGIVIDNFETEIDAGEGLAGRLRRRRDGFEKTYTPKVRLSELESAKQEYEAQRALIDSYIFATSKRTPIGQLERLADLMERWRQIKGEAQKDVREVREVDRIRDEYLEFGGIGIRVPKPEEFLELGPPWNSGQYKLAVIDEEVMKRALRIRAASGADITSAYRNPRKQVIEVGGPVTSSHCQGWAIDFRTRDTAAFVAVAKIACAERPSWIEPWRDVQQQKHCHVDWRENESPDSSYCNAPTTPVSFACIRRPDGQLSISWALDSKGSSVDEFIIEIAVGSADFVEVRHVEAHKGVKGWSIKQPTQQGRVRVRMRAYTHWPMYSPYTPIVDIRK